MWRNQWHLEVVRHRDDKFNFNFIYQNWNTCIWNFVKSGFWLGWNDVNWTTAWNCVGTGEIYIPDKPFQNTIGFTHLGVTSRNSLRKTTTVMWFFEKNMFGRKRHEKHKTNFTSSMIIQQIWQAAWFNHRKWSKSLRKRCFQINGYQHFYIIYFNYCKSTCLDKE